MYKLQMCFLILLVQRITTTTTTTIITIYTTTTHLYGLYEALSAHDSVATRECLHGGLGVHTYHTLQI